MLMKCCCVVDSYKLALSQDKQDKRRGGKITYVTLQKLMAQLLEELKNGGIKHKAVVIGEDNLPVHIDGKFIMVAVV